MSRLPIVQKAGGIVLQSHTKKIVVVINQFSTAVLPKGSIEAGESPEAAAQREIREETGLSSLQKIAKLGIIQRAGHQSSGSQKSDVMKHIHMYLYVTAEMTLQPRLDDSLHAEWVDLSDAPGILGWPEEAAFVAEQSERIRSAAR
jgi:ADP-ribose pyrophosphatase YjhB (NUDIX family)